MYSDFEMITNNNMVIRIRSQHNISSVYTVEDMEVESTKISINPDVANNIDPTTN